MFMIKKKITYLEDVVSAYHRVKLKEKENIDEFLDSYQKAVKNVKHDGNSGTS